MFISVAEPVFDRIRRKKNLLVSVPIHTTKYEIKSVEKCPQKYDISRLFRHWKLES